MLIPDSQRTTENIKKNIYDNIRNTYYNYASKWNAIWCVWRDNSPNWSGNWFSGWHGAAIRMHDQIPYDLRQLNTKAYEGIAGEVNPSIPVESQRIHTIGNENYIRNSMNGFNTTLIEKFSEGEYNGAGGFLTYKLVKSYGVLYVKSDLVGNFISEQKYYVKEFEKFNDNYSIILYNDEDCTSQALTTTIVRRDSTNKYSVKWTGERYYKTISVNPYKQSGSEQPYSCPTLSSNVTSIGSNMITVSNAELGATTYQLFNGVANYLKFRTGVTETNPVIVYFQIGKSFRMTNYTIIADSTSNGCEYPINWKIQGSNDKSVWVTVDNRVNESFTKGQTKNFEFYNPNYYLFYRFVVTKYNKASGEKFALRRFTFSGRYVNVTPNYEVIQPYKIGSTTSVNVSTLGVKTDFYIESTTNNYDKFSSPKYSDDDSGKKIEDNQENIYTYFVNNNWSLNNVEQGVRQDNLIKKEDYEQLQRLLSKINSVLKLRDGWFDSNGRCNYSCQVACQNRCQLSCQACNTSQCHNQKCGTH